MKEFWEAQICSIPEHVKEKSRRKEASYRREQHKVEFADQIERYEAGERALERAEAVAEARRKVEMIPHYKDAMARCSKREPVIHEVPTISHSLLDTAALIESLPPTPEFEICKDIDSALNPRDEGGQTLVFNGFTWTL